MEPESPPLSQVEASYRAAAGGWGPRGFVKMEEHGWMICRVNVWGAEGEVRSLMRRETRVVLWTKTVLNLNSLSAGSDDN